MTKRLAAIFSVILVGAVLSSVALTSFAYAVKDALVFDPFAELTLCNNSDQAITEAVLTQGDLTIISRNLPPGERRPLRFGPHPHVLGNRYALTVRFADGRVLPDYGGDIGIGEKHNKRIRNDGSDTGIVRSNSL